MQQNLPVGIQRQRDLLELAQLTKEKARLEKKIHTIRKRLVRNATRSSGAEETIVEALQHGPLRFMEIVEVTGLNRNTAKAALRLMRHRERVIYEDRKYSVE